MTKSFVLVLAIAIAFVSCKPKEKASSASACQLDNFLSAYIDTTVKPQDDFFSFTMGKWVHDNPVPASERSWGIWTMVDEENYGRIKGINEEAASKNAEKGSNWQKIGDFWHTGMDTASIEEQGIKPLQPELDKINALTDVN